MAREKIKMKDSFLCVEYRFVSEICRTFWASAHIDHECLDVSSPFPLPPLHCHILSFSKPMTPGYFFCVHFHSFSPAVWLTLLWLGKQSTGIDLWQALKSIALSLSLSLSLIHNPHDDAQDGTDGPRINLNCRTAQSFGHSFYFWLSFLNSLSLSLSLSFCLFKNGTFQFVNGK